MIFLVTLIPLVLWSNPMEGISSWLDSEYKNFRVHPRISRAYSLSEEGKIQEAKALLQKALEIDSKNQEAIEMMMNLCIKEKDEPCINKYLDSVKESSAGYIYSHKAQQAKEQKNYNQAITYAKKASQYDLKEEDTQYYNQLILFESYLAKKEYAKANDLIRKDELVTYELLKWSRISSNLKDNEYAYTLAVELPDKKEYVQWRLDLLLQKKEYVKASKEMDKLYKMEPSQENLKQLVYLYEITNQNRRMVKIYERQLREGCNEYALLYLFESYGKNIPQQRALLEKNYPFSCLAKKKRLTLSTRLVHLLKSKKPKKAKYIANEIAGKLNSEKQRLALYQESGQKNKVVKLYQDKLTKGCDEYALMYLLDYFRKSKGIQKQLLEENYPYRCLPHQKRVDLTMQLVMLLEKDNLPKVKPLIDTLNIHDIDASHYVNLANIYVRLEDYQKSKSYMLAYLEQYPNDSSALKSLGYTYFKLDEKDTSLGYLLQAAKADMNDGELLKNIGYLCAELEHFEMAISYWKRYLSLQSDAEVELELAYLYLNLNQQSSADKFLRNYEALEKNRTHRYYLLKGRLAARTKNCNMALSYYDKALGLESDVHVNYEYVQLLKSCNQPQKALAVLKELSTANPDKLLYKKELAYMYEKQQEYDNSIKHFQQLVQEQPDKVSSYIALANVQKKFGDTDAAIASYKQAIDSAKDIKPKQLIQMKQEITNSSKPFNIYASQTARLDGDKGKGSYASVPNALYDGFGFVEFSYRPRFLPKNTTLFANVIHDHDNLKASAQPSLGIRYKPLEESNFYLSAQQMFKTGKNTRNDTVLRASLGISNEEKNPSDIYQNLYLDANYFVANNAKVVSANYEVGKEYKVDKGVTISPYITTGGSLTDDNAQKRHITNLDAGIGLAVTTKSDETRYEIGAYTNRLKLEARKQYAGNSQDENVIRLQWEFFF